MLKQVKFSPHDPLRFAVASNEVRMYELRLSAGTAVHIGGTAAGERTSGSSSAGNSSRGAGTAAAASPAAAAPAPAPVRQKPEAEIVLLSQQGGFPWIKCFEWCPDSRDANLLALGLPNGNVRLMDMFPADRHREVQLEAPPGARSSISALSVAKEFVPRNQRACNALAWNPVFTNHIAAALDRVRGDYSTLVWDINQSPVPATSQDKASRSAGRAAKSHPAAQRTSGSHMPAPSDTAEVIVTPYVELGSNDCAVALSWVPNMPHCLLSGTSSKWMRLYDLRADHNAPQHAVAHNKSVFGLSFNPFRETQLLTYSEDGIIKLWDSRRITHAVSSFNVGQRALQDVQWCPTRPDRIATIVKNESTINFWDVRAVTAHGASVMEGSEEIPESMRNSDDSAVTSGGLLCFILKPTRIFATPDPPCSIGWNATNQYRMLYAGVAGGVEILSLQEAIPVSWSASSCSLSFGFGRELVEGVPNSTTQPQNAPMVWDISAVMQDRAKRGYSMLPAGNIELMMGDCARFPENADGAFASSPRELLTFWSWMRDFLSGKLSKLDVKSEQPAAADSENTLDSAPASAGMIDPNSDFLAGSELPRFVGITATLASLATHPSRHVKSVGEKVLMFGIYSAPVRNTCLELCGWGFEKRDLESTLARLEANDEYERAATIALFHLDIKRALSCLARGSEKRSAANERSDALRIVAMALSGFSPNATLWRETCLDPVVFQSLKHPYLKACFSFLCKDESTTFKRVLMNDFNGIALVDQIGFACRFLDDSDLLEFVEAAATKLTRAGRLEGMLLVGMSPRGVDLFEQYINRTGDVQTAALALSHVTTHFSDARISRWRSVYRDLLDQWQLWHARAKFDIASGKALGSERAAQESVPPQIYVRCNICNASIAAPQVAAKRGSTTATTVDARGRGRGGSMGASRFSPSRFTSREAGTEAPRGPASSKQRELSSCPQCKKPLPRCSICLLSLGVALPVTPNVAFGSAGSRALRPQPTEFDQWFAWCQSCRHGGHAKHLEEWFSKHRRCPVTDCDCPCLSIS